MGSPMKIVHVVGARPNFMKVAPLHRAFAKYSQVQSTIVHTGQHSDPNMSNIFLQQLELPKPNYFLGISTGSYAEQMTAIMYELEKVFLELKPDLVIVVGDVNSTLAGALVANSMQIPLAHVEAGLRSFDPLMQEENNRILVDHLGDFLFTTESSANENLARELIPGSKIHFVGNCMIDSLITSLPQIYPDKIRQQLGLSNSEYALATMHRPANVDTPDGIYKIMQLLKLVSGYLKIVFPVHPRTKLRLKEFGLWDELNSIQGILITEPLGYLEFLGLLKETSVVLTDSGGLQEEATYLQLPCLTFRQSTERPVTIDIGSNVLVKDFNLDEVTGHIQKITSGNWKKSEIPPLWDGQASKRIAEILVENK